MASGSQDIPVLAPGEKRKRKTRHSEAAESASGSGDIPVPPSGGKKRKKTRHLEEEGDSGRLLLVAEPHSSAQSPMKADEQFTPERVELEEDEDDDGGSSTHGYRFVCRRAGRFQCTSTNLVFVLEGEGQIVYSIVNWDRQIVEALGQFTPAGPLYRISCPGRTVKEVHFPHSEIFSEEKEWSLSVAHVTQGNVEVLEPLALEETHVALKIEELSLFGLLKEAINRLFPVHVKVFFSLQKHTEEENILHVFLLPSSIPVSQVQEQYPTHSFIDTKSDCELTSGTQYSLRSDTPDTHVSPKTATFRCRFGPDYYSRFQVLVRTNSTAVQLGLWEENGREAWEPQPVYLPVSDARPMIRSSQETPDQLTPYTLNPCHPAFRRRLLSEKRDKIYLPLEKSQRRRSALLVTNIHFKYLSDRPGAERDEANMLWLLTALGFMVQKHTDLNGDAMKQAVDSFADGSNHEQTDGTFVVMMSHGDRVASRDILLGVDYDPILNNTDIFYIEEIFTSPDTEKCPKLIDKPKIVLIQACRGVLPGGVEVETDDWKHKEKDFACFMSCVPHVQAYRHPEHGSPFINCIMDVFCTSAHNFHIAKLFFVITEQMRDHPNYTGAYRLLSCLERSTLGKKFYLFPGL